MTEKIVSQDSVGMVFGRLTVVREFRRPIRTIPNKTELMWECSCVCGKVKSIRAVSIKRKLTQSCGCYHTECIRTHHQTHTPEYGVWHGIKQRTGNPNNPSSSNYSERGIRLCERWMKFENFFADMGERPTPKHTIERRNNDGIYEPDNCYWATRDVQNRNNRRTRFITFNSETLCLSDWATRIGIDSKSISYRLRRWPIELALTTPPLKGKKLILRSTHKIRE